MFVLRDELESEKRGKDVYLAGNTMIGPMYTEDLEEAIRFFTKRDAMLNPAYLHSLAFFEPYEINDKAPTDNR